jgi:hypothetical protein
LCTAISAAVGIGIQIAAGLVQFGLSIENHLFPFLMNSFRANRRAVSP